MKNETKEKIQDDQLGPIGSIVAGTFAGGMFFVGGLLGLWILLSYFDGKERDECNYVDPCQEKCLDRDTRYKVTHFRDLCINVQRNKCEKTCKERGMVVAADYYWPHDCSCDTIPAIKSVLQHVREQVEEDNKKSELKSMSKAEAAQTAEEICLDKYLGAKYKKGICEIPFGGKISKLEDLKKKKAFENCQIDGIKQGKNNSATANAVCNGVKAKIILKNYQAQKRSVKNR